MIFVFYFFAAILILLGCGSLRGGANYLNYFKNELAKPEPNFAPFCSVIAPCRGFEEGLSENLNAIFRQNYPNYEVVFVVDDKGDKALRIIENVLLKKSPRVKAKLVIAGKAVDCGQKVHNLRQAVLKTSAESRVFVFVDSDARPGENWLKHLVAPLRGETIGAATGYRWFIAKDGGFFSALLSVWNASIASALGAPEKNNFCWGGSTAIRRDVFEQIEMREKWRGTLSDDFTLTAAMKEANLKIHFAPGCLTASVKDCGFGELIEFTTRQMKITRVYAPHLWKASFIGSILFTFTFWTGFALLFFLFGFHFWLTLAFLLAIFALGAAKGAIRLSAVKLVLRDYRNELNKQFIAQISLWTLTPALYFYNCLCASMSREIVWRGVKYVLKSPNKTVIIANEDEE